MYQREAQRLKFVASKSLDRVVCADAESYRVQQGLAAQEAKDARKPDAKGSEAKKPEPKKPDAGGDAAKKAQ